jgi:hypothetical protein
MRIEDIKISLAEAQGFAKVWTCNGVAVLMDKHACQFAADFATIAVRSFVQQYLQREAEKAAPKIQVVKD